MTEAVLDASVILKWFRGEGERHLAAARSLRAAFEAGEPLVFAPPLLRLVHRHQLSYELVTNEGGEDHLWLVPSH